jgi:hypothetical protein
MGKMPSKKAHERRKKPRSEKKPTLKVIQQVCLSCGKKMNVDARALYVEEEVGRIFCAEECITHYFTPEVEKLEKEYLKQHSQEDLSNEEREELNHLRWLTLQEPDEIWREKVLSGDLRYTLISEFNPKTKTVWYICICLYLRGEPSFLFLAFPTKDKNLVNAYRRGERIEKPESPDRPNQDHEVSPTDGLAEAWTEGETLRAQLMEGRKRKDIPTEDYNLYHGCVDETLEEPDEVWVAQRERESGIKTYHFIRYYPNEQPSMWFVLIARETENEDEIEILDAFPTQSSELVECYRRGKQEVGAAELSTQSRLVH